MIPWILIFARIMASPPVIALEVAVVIASLFFLKLRGDLAFDPNRSDFDEVQNAEQDSLLKKKKRDMDKWR
jgi:hypothetical protein